MNKNNLYEEVDKHILTAPCIGHDFEEEVDDGAYAEDDEDDSEEEVFYYTHYKIKTDKLFDYPDYSEKEIFELIEDNELTVLLENEIGVTLCINIHDFINDFVPYS